MVNSLDYYQEYLNLQPSLFRESDNLHLLLKSIFQSYDLQQQDFLWLSDNILNIDLAEKSQLDFIGNIVGQSRFLIDFNTENYFGFQNAYQSETFGSSGIPFIGGYWNSRSYFNTSTSKVLSDAEYRRLIKARVIFNSSSCKPDDLLEVINLITNKKDNSVQTISQGVIKISSSDDSGLLSYFVDRLKLVDNILPIAAGVGVVTYNVNDDGSDTALGRFGNELEKLVNEDLPDEP